MSEMALSFIFDSYRTATPLNILPTRSSSCSMLTAHFNICRSYSLALSRMALAVFVLSHSGCFPDYWPQHTVKDKLSEEQLVGQWRLASGNHNQIRDREGKKLPQKLDIMATGVYQVERTGGEPVFAQGGWTLRHGLMGDTGEIEANVVEVRAASRDAINDRFSVSADRNGLVLWRYQGDPDDGEFVEYHKVK